MMGSEGFRQERPSKGSSGNVGSKDPKVPSKGRIESKTFDPGAYLYLGFVWHSGRV